MFNEITIGPLTLHTYGLMIGLGFLAAYAMCYYRGKKMKMEKSGDILYGIFWCAIIGGLVGTRLLYYIVEIPEIIKDPSILWNFKNGYVVYGGIIGGILVSWLYCRIKKVSFIEYFDLVMPAVALAQGFGRIGCFFAGCCVGMRYQGPGSIRYLDNGAAGEYLFPVQLVETLLFLLAFLLLHRMAERKRNGIIPKSLLLYAILKFVLDYLRYYEDRKIFSANQWGCLLVAVSVLLYEAVRQIKQRANNKVI